MVKFSSEIELRGHIIDSLILTKVFDGIMDHGGSFEVLEIKVGKKKKDESYAKLLVIGKNAKNLETILNYVYRQGATSKSQKNVKLVAASKNMVMPDNFYSTTNNQTQIFLNNKWIDVDNTMMDKCIVVKAKKAMCVPIRQIKKGDKIVVGENGVKIIPPERPREGMNVFEFMGSGSSSERPIQHIARKVAEDMRRTKRNGGKIVLVAGPAIVHTGATESVSALIRGGYINAVLAGNALAVHDIEYAILGTSLGMNIRDGTLAVRGHRNHMEAINAVFNAGSIEKMVKSKKLTRGIMYECVKKKVPFVLAGSIRDDGPLPDVITDISLAQKKYKDVLKDASLVIMVASMLHSIATGNMLPANVKVIVVDINQPTVTKLMDRGTWQALGVVSDAGAFLPMVAKEL
ncbi:MAG: TIGR00300 family protein [Thaumarchaeota archaeon]|mgnify:FL=1|jgi:lysine-ketoglutarate reductase/saccharopine dehydrogenase-like protein (TIGR00300 family)|nr:MAG: TIGR00300 family protein [Nitrososphaerota archaeon]HIA10421.1 TIGR00300 family protein [Candidatus Nitrosopelagicus sp.]HIA97068.1 TIGR00300 family protein [Candidatus Nitrosopelagicus sp.]|tara:strand:- start:1034 stop:2245 length:1212 start_codon:yes stop_codon:yes gene_type:complete